MDMIDRVDVYLDDAAIGQTRRIGLLRRAGRGDAPISFSYDPEWLGDRNFFILDPSHFPYQGDQFPARGRLIAGVFSDCSPDRWGRLVMERSEAERALEGRRQPRVLDEWDFLLRVNDLTRMGALRLRDTQSGEFVAPDPQSPPPLTDLEELQRAARVIEAGGPDTAATERALALLLAPGSSLGGARPKATIVGSDGDAWIAKFPAANDRRDVAAWEEILNILARQSGIDVPESRTELVAGRYRTFLARRFDRTREGGRRLYASAMTLTEKVDRQRASYADIAEAIERHGAPGSIADDLAQLFRRAVFNVMVGHRDDHLRNHGFLRSSQGWRLAPAFDLNPVPELANHELAVGLESHLPSIDLAAGELAPLCRLTRDDAAQIVEEVRTGTSDWETLARDLHVPRTEIALMGSAFLAQDHR